MEPRLNKVFQRFNKDAEYHTFINETEAERDSSNAAEQEAVAAAERAKRDARNARIEKSKAAVEEWNKNTSMTRNKVEAKAQTRVDKMMKVAQKAAADCWDHAQSLDDVFDIWRKYLSELNNIPANEPLEQDGVPVNPTGMYYSYVITAGTKDYSKPMGIPCTSGYTTGFYKDEIRWAESELND